MKNTVDELDEYGKRTLAPLREAPELNPDVASGEKARYISQAEGLRQSLPPRSAAASKGGRKGINWFFGRQSTSMIKILGAALLVLVVLLGSSLTVYAADVSLPGEPLYSIKSLSEDVRLSLTRSPQARLDLTLAYTNRRMNEISRLLEMGGIVPDQAAVRYQNELDSALELAAEMNDYQMQSALAQIKSQAENQGISLEELINRLPPQAEPAIAVLQARLREQVVLSSIGEKDPQGFRFEIHARQLRHPGKTRSTPGGNDLDDTHGKRTSTAVPLENGNGHGNDQAKPTKEPGQGGQGPGKGNQNPGNGNNSPDVTSTPGP